MFVRRSGHPSSSTNHDRIRASGTSSSMGLSVALMGLSVALDKDLCKPSDVGDESQLLGQVVLVASQQAQQRHLFDASRSSREAVASACIRSTTRPKANRLRTTHATRDGPCGHVFATILGREPRVAAGPFSGQVEPGSPHSPSRRDAGLEDVRGIEQPRKLAK